MSLVTKTRPAATKPATPPAVVANGLTKTMTREAEAQRKRPAPWASSSRPPSASPPPPASCPPALTKPLRRPKS
jgi:hypothetical protein